MPRLLDTMTNPSLEFAHSEFEKLRGLAQIKPEPNLTAAFKPFAEEVFSNWLIKTNTDIYEIIEAEFLLQTINDVHRDPNIDASMLQKRFGHWYIPDGGIDITFGCPEYAAAIYIRGLRNISTKELIIGPKRSYRTLFQDAGHIVNSHANPQFLPKKDRGETKSLWNIPRVNLSVEERHDDREYRLNYLFRPYRFITKDVIDFPDKYLANLYLEKITCVKPPFKVECKIYNKYLDAFDKGIYAGDRSRLWQLSSRSMRLAGLMGYQHQNLPNTVI